MTMLSLLDVLIRFRVPSLRWLSSMRYECTPFLPFMLIKCQQFLVTGPQWKIVSQNSERQLQRCLCHTIRSCYFDRYRRVGCFGRNHKCVFLPNICCFELSESFSHCGPPTISSHPILSSTHHRKNWCNTTALCLQQQPKYSHRNCPKHSAN